MFSNILISCCQILAYWIVRAYRLFARIHVDVVDYGSTQISRSEPLLIAANHQSRLDGFVLTTAIPFSRFIKILPISYITKNSYLNTPIKRGLLYLLGLYPAKPMHNKKYGLKAATHRIQKGHSLFFFPEGQRALARSVRPKKGALLLAKTHQMTVLPMHIAWERGKRRLARITIGGPRCITGIAPLDEQAKQLMNQVYELEKAH